MELLRKVAEFSTSVEEKKNIYVLYIGSILEQSSVVWHNSLTQENSDDCAVRIILGENFKNYEEALTKSDLDSLKNRRENLSKTFAKRCLKKSKTKSMFPAREKNHTSK